MTSERALSAADLVGTWRLRTWISTGDDGAVLPMGESPEGVLVYTADGTMITTMGWPGRASIDGGDMLAGPDDQRLEAFTSFIAYSGTFQVEGGDVVHDVLMSLFPNWVGTRQVRHVSLSADGRALELSTDPVVLRGRLSVQRLTWERIGT